MTVSESAPLGDATPSAKLVVKVLEHEAPLTQREVIEKTMLSDRGARKALSELEEMGVVTKRRGLRDARRKIYALDQSSAGRGV